MAPPATRRAPSRPDLTISDRVDAHERHDAEQDTAIGHLAREVEAVKQTIGRLPDPLKEGDEGEGIAGVLGRMYREQSIDRAIRERRALLWGRVVGVLGAVAAVSAIIGLALKLLGRG